MQVRRLLIERFRGIEQLELHPGMRTLLVGPNNTGKSTVLEALDLLLHAGEGRPRPAPREIDYFDRDPSAGFRIEAVLGGLTLEQRADLLPALEGWRAEGNELVPEPDGEGIESVVRVQAEGTPEFEVLHSFAKDEIAGRRFGRRERSQIGWVFDGRTRDPSRELAFYQGGMLDQLFGSLELGEPVDAIRAALDAGAREFNEDTGVAAELAGLGNDLRGLGFADAGDPAFEAGAISQRELLQTLRVALPGHGGQRIPLARQGRGQQRLLVLAILLRLSRARRGPILIGGFEEPEEALEPLRQAQAASMLESLAETGGQVFISTHSPQILRAFRPRDIILLEPGRSPAARPLATALSVPARYALERRTTAPTASALFVPAPAIVEGPSDVAVFETFWDALAAEEVVAQRTALGLDFVSAEGAPMMAMSVQLLREAGKSVIAVVELDTDQAAKVLAPRHAACLVLYPDRSEANNLERLLAESFPVDALVAAMTRLAHDRGDDWTMQRAHLLERLPNIVTDRPRRDAFAAATDLPAAAATITEPEARQLVATVLALSGHAPFEIKSSGPARVFAEALVAAGGVADPWRRALIELAAWLATPVPRAEISIAL